MLVQKEQHQEDLLRQLEESTLKVQDKNSRIEELELEVGYLFRQCEESVQHVKELELEAGNISRQCEESVQEKNRRIEELELEAGNISRQCEESVQEKKRRIEELELDVGNHLDQTRELEERIRQISVQHERAIPDDDLGNFILLRSDIVVKESRNLGHGSYGSKCFRMNNIP